MHVAAHKQESLQSDGVANSKDRRVEVNLDTALLGVDECLTRRKAQLAMNLGGTYPSVMQLVGINGGRHISHRRKEHVATSLVLLRLETERCLEAPLLLALESELLAVVEHHLLHVAPLERSEHIILIGVHELVGGRADIVG